MNFLKKLFGISNTSSPTTKAAPTIPEFPSDSPGFQGDLIQVYDKFGRPLKITRFDWFNNVLKGYLEKAGTNRTIYPASFLRLFKMVSLSKWKPLPSTSIKPIQIPNAELASSLFSTSKPTAHTKQKQSSRNI